MALNARFKTRDQAGSISPLIILYFSIILILIFIISNVASVYIARRDLISRAEAAIHVAAQELDELRYYYGAPITGFLADQSIASGTLRVPIDCGDAGRKFAQILSSSTNAYASVRNETRLGKVDSTSRYSSESSYSQARIEGINCDGFDISAKVSEVHELPFQLRVLGITSYVNIVEVGTASFLLSHEQG